MRGSKEKTAVFFLDVEAIEELLGVYLQKFWRTIALITLSTKKPLKWAINKTGNKGPEKNRDSKNLWKIFESYVHKFQFSLDWGLGLNSVNDQFSNSGFILQLFWSLVLFLRYRCLSCYTLMLNCKWAVRCLDIVCGVLDLLRSCCCDYLTTLSFKKQSGGSGIHLQSHYLRSRGLQIFVSLGPAWFM